MDKNYSKGRALLLALAVLATATSACGKSKTKKGAEIAGMGAGCYHYTTKDKKFEYKSQEATVETKWWDEWTSRYGKTLPEPLPAPDHWMHPKLSSRYAATMHEDSFATDVSKEPGPIPNEAKVEYFHVLEKGTKLSGMAPFFTYLDDHTIITISFGRDSAMLLIVDISGEAARVLDYVALPGRGSKALELAKKSARMAMFRDTSGGAYSYLDAKGEVYVPGADNTIVRIPIRDHRVDREHMLVLDLSREIEAGSWVDKAMEHPENHLTALMPDAEGDIWFTSKFGVVGMLVPQDGGSGKVCPPVYTTAIMRFALAEKLKHFYPDGLPPGGEEFIAKVEKYDAEGTLVEHLGDIRREGLQLFGDIFEGEPIEQIQNSFTVGPDGVYIATNVALYKLFFNKETRHIELDPSWKPTYEQQDLIYDNDRKVKPGHLNNGTGTTPTLVQDRFVAMVDNAPGTVNLNIFRQKDGTLVSKHPLFMEGAGAVENSVVAYEDHLIVGNTYGYVDPFIENPTAGGIERYDYDAEKDAYAKVEGWPAVGHFDGKTATPKLSTAHGLFYVYHRDINEEASHNDWQLTALDFRSGWPVFSIKGYFDGDDFGDNVSGIVAKKTLGKEDYGKKVFNNIWGTFSFGPRNSVFIGAYRGYVRFSSAPTLGTEATASEPAAEAASEPEAEATELEAAD